MPCLHLFLQHFCLGLSKELSAFAVAFCAAQALEVRDER